MASSKQQVKTHSVDLSYRKGFCKVRNQPNAQTDGQCWIEQPHMRTGAQSFVETVCSVLGECRCALAVVGGRCWVDVAARVFKLSVCGFRFQQEFFGFVRYLLTWGA